MIFEFNIEKVEAGLELEYDEDEDRMTLYLSNGECRNQLENNVSILNDILYFVSQDDSKIGDSFDTCLGKATLRAIEF